MLHKILITTFIANPCAMKKKCLVWGLLSICLPMVLVGQYVPQPTATLPQNEPIQKLVDEVSPFGWLYFRDNLSVPDSQFFSIYGQFFGLRNDDEMRLYQRDTDGQGYTIARFRQYYKGIPVEGGEYSLHSRNDQLTIGHGKIIEELNMPTLPEMEELYALRRAIDALGVKTYAWQDPSWEESIQEEMEDSTARYFPKGQLRLMLLSGDQLIHTRYRLVWYFEIRTLDPDDFLSVFVDTRTGEILKVSSIRRTCSQQSGTAQTLYNNYQNLDMRQRGWPHRDFVLEDCRDIETKFHDRNTFGETRGWKWVDKISHTDNDWDATHIHATSAHWAAQKAWDYFEETFDLDGPDGDGKATRVWVDWKDANGDFIADAMFEPSSKSNYLYIGHNANGSLATLDIIGHEYSHGVVAGSAGLVYERESGALDESFADIFGLLIENYTDGETNTKDWLIGEDIGALRSLANPHAYDQPKFYGEADPHWFDASTRGCEIPMKGPVPVGNDFCGVHINGGVQNYWFFLLTNGGWVEEQQVQVYGIGLEKAAQIVYYNLTRYMQSHSNYQDARLGSIQAAKDLFGECSNEVAQVKNAWAAVGVGEPNEQLCVEIEGPPFICEDQLHLWHTFTVSSVDGTLIEWADLPENWFYDISGYDGGTLTFKGIVNPGEVYDLHLIGRNDETFEEISFRIRFGECAAEDTSWKTDPDSLPDWSFIPGAGGERMSVTLPEGIIPATVGVYDMQGRRQQELFIQERSFSLELDGVSDGIYFLRIEGNSTLLHKMFRLIR